MSYRQSAEEIRKKYRDMRLALNDAFAKDVSFEDKILTQSDYRIARRRIVLMRQKELLDGGFLINDEMFDENGKSLRFYELDWINDELTEGVKDRPLICPHDPYPHNPYPEKVKRG